MPSEKTMLSLLLAALLASTAAYLPYAGSGSRTTVAATQPSAAARQTSASATSRGGEPTAEQIQQISQTHADAASLIADHFGIHLELDRTWFSDGDPTATPAYPDEHRLEALKAAIPDNTRVDFVIATLPYAIDSNSRWQFDPLYDSIQRAAGASGYVLDRFYIPDWDASRNPDEDAPAASRLHERLPGVVLFRRAEGDAPQLLVLFIVFETPTSGVHQLAFRRAVWTMIQWRASQTVRVVGPTFSGSISSLAQAMRSARADVARLSAYQRVIPEPYYRVVSGSATNTGNGRELIKGVGNGIVSYHSTVLTDDELLDALRNFLEERLDRGRIAVLVEGNTAYGEELRRRLLVPGKLCKPNCPVLPFPLHISRIRGAALAGDLNQLTTTAGVRRAVPLLLAEPVQPKDLVPPMAPGLTSSSTDAALAAILSTIEREKISAIGLFATDSRDKLFLAQQVSLRSPDTLLFTIEGDLLLAHPDYRRYTDGMIVASSYPLLNATQLWKPTATLVSARQQFISTNAQGVYNAALALLNYTESGTSTAVAGAMPPPLLDYRRPMKGRRGPYAWISVVGNDGIWPLHRDELTCPAEALACDAYTQPIDARIGNVVEPTDRPISISPSMLAFFVAIQAFILLHAWWWLERGKQSVTGWWFPPNTYLDPTDQRMFTRGLRLAASCVAAVFVVQLAILLVLNRYNAVLGEYATDELASWLQFTGSFLCGLLLVIVAALPRRRNRRADVTLLAIGGVLGVAVIGYGLVPWLSEAILGEDALILLNRGLQPLSGASPFLPLLLLLLGIYGCLATQCVRVVTPTLSERLSAPGHGRSLAALATGNFEKLVTDVKSAISLPLGISGGRLAAVAIVLVAALFFTITQRVQTAERAAFDIVFAGGWLILQAIVCLTLAQHYQLWKSTKALLKGLAVHPMAAAFDRVPRDLFRNRMPAKGPRLIHLQHAVNIQVGVMSGLWSLYRSGEAAAVLDLQSMDAGERRRWLHRAIDWRPPEMLPDNERELKALQSSLELGTKLAADLESHYPVARSRTWKALVEGVGTLLPWSERTWRRRKPAETGQASSRDAYGAWHSDAETFLAMPVALLIRELTGRVVRGLYVIFASVVLLSLYQSSFRAYPGRSMLAVTWLYIATAVIAVFVTVVSAERDAVLSRLSGTSPGKIQWDSAFLMRTLVPLVLAMVTLFATQFPETGGAVLRWLRPVQTALP